MSNDKVKVLYRRIKENFHKNSYINLNHTQLRNKYDLAELSLIFRNPYYETFRIIYMKDDIVVGHEAISSRLPNCTKIFPTDKQGRYKTERDTYKIYNRMNRLSANGYYLVHNHTSNQATASKEDIKTTAFFYNLIPGFKGHLIINCNTYAWIDIKDDEIYLSNNNKIKKENKLINREIEKNGIYNIKIKNRFDLVSLMNNIKNTKNYSTAIITDTKNFPRMVLDIPNNFLNMKNKQLRGYFENVSKCVGGSKLFIATDDSKTYERCLELAKENIFVDTILYEKDKDNDKLKVKSAYTPEDGTTETNKGIFDCKGRYIRAVRVNESKEKYNLEYKPEKFLTILYKKTDELPKVTKIPNTLDAKQKLVGGLIEVVPYNDVLIICNEEGKILNLKPNLIFDYDYIAGDCFLVGDDYLHGDFKSLTSEQIEKYTKELIQKSNGGIDKESYYEK